MNDSVLLRCLKLKRRTEEALAELKLKRQEFFITSKIPGGAKSSSSESMGVHQSTNSTKNTSPVGPAGSPWYLNKVCMSQKTRMKVFRSNVGYDSGEELYNCTVATKGQVSQILFCSHGPNPLG